MFGSIHLILVNVLFFIFAVTKTLSCVQPPSPFAIDPIFDIRRKSKLDFMCEQGFNFPYTTMLIFFENKILLLYLQEPVWSLPSLDGPAGSTAVRSAD